MHNYQEDHGGWVDDMVLVRSLVSCHMEGIVRIIIVIYQLSIDMPLYTYYI